MLAGILLQVAWRNSVVSVLQSTCGFLSGNLASLFILVCVSFCVPIIGYVLIYVHIWLVSWSITFSAVSFHNRFNVFVSSRSKGRSCLFHKVCVLGISMLKSSYVLSMVSYALSLWISLLKSFCRKEVPTTYTKSDESFYYREIRHWTYICEHIISTLAENCNKSVIYLSWNMVTKKINHTLHLKSLLRSKILKNTDFRQKNRERDSGGKKQI